MKLTEVAIQLFEKKGFEEVVFKDIARVAHITQPALYSYFSNKLDLLADCCLLAAQKGRESIDSEINLRASPDQQLRKYVEANLRWFHQNRGEASCLLAMYYFALGNDRLKTIFDQIEQTGISRIETLLAQGQHVHKRKSKNLHHIACFLHSCIVGEVIKVLYEPRRQNFTHRAAQICQVFESGL